MDWPQKTLLDSWCPKRKQVEIKITEKNGESLFNSLASKVMIAVIRMIKINMIRRAVIKSDHPGRNCCRRSVVTTGGGSCAIPSPLGRTPPTPPASYQ